MRKSLYICVFIIISVMMSCGDKKSAYNVSVKVNGENDTASLYVYEPDYNSIRLLEQRPVKKGYETSFSGANTGKKIAFFKLTQDTLAYYFVLDSIPLSIAVGGNKIIINSGSAENRRIVKLSSRISKIKNQIKENRIKYLKLVSDSTMTEVKEAAYNNRNKKLISVMQNMILNEVKDTSACSYIVMKRFGKELVDSLVPMQYR